MRLILQCLTTSALFATGDIIAQKLDNKQYIPRKTVLMASWGVFIAIFVPKWHRILERTASGLLHKVSLDLLMSVPLNSLLICANQSYVCGCGFRDSGEFVSRLKRLSVLSVFGVPCGAFNLCYVSVEYRSMVLGLFGVLFTCASSLVLGSSPEE
jgi:hypothetical protein